MSEICLLCKERKVYHIKSHLTPAGITENSYGERNKEVIYTLDREKKSVDMYYGREYPQNQTTEIKAEPNARKGIFCKKCETDFGTYESEVQNKLNKFLNSLGYTIEIKKTVNKARYAHLDFHPNVLITFFLSIVWRQCIEQILDEKDNPISDDELERLRILVLQMIALPINEVINHGIIQKPKILIFTTFYTKEQPTWVNPHPTETNPQIFFIGPVTLLYWLDKEVTKDFEKATFIDNNLLDDNITLDKSIIGIVNHKLWKKISDKISRYLVKGFMN